MSQPDFDWNRALGQIDTDSQERQAKRKVLEGSILDTVNSLPMPEGFMEKLTMTIEDANFAASQLAEKYKNEEDFAPLVDGILFRTSGKRDEIFSWGLQHGISPIEGKRRADVLKRFTYRRQVLQQAYHIATEDDWSYADPTTPRDLMVTALRAAKDAKTLEFDDNYTDQLF